MNANPFNNPREAAAKLTATNKAAQGLQEAEHYPKCTSDSGATDISGTRQTPNRIVIEQLQQQLKHFRTRTPNRSIASQLAEQLRLANPGNLGSSSDNQQSALLQTQEEPWNDLTQLSEDWDEENAIDLHGDDLHGDDRHGDDLPVASDLPVDGELPTSHPAIPAGNEARTEDVPDLCETFGQGSTTTQETTNQETMWDGPTIYPTTCPALNGWFPDQGIPAGSILEVVCSEAGAGATHFCLTLAKAVCGAEGLLVVIDRRHDFHAASLVSLGFDLQNVLLIRPTNDEDHLWALEQALAHPSAAVVWTRIDLLDGRYQRRWQLAAEKSQAVGILQRPDRVLGAPSWAFAQFQIRPNPHSSLLTGNRAYYQAVNRARQKAASASGLTPHDENWILDLKAVRMRGQFQPQILRMELHNFLAEENANDQIPSNLSMRPAHPNDPPVTREFNPTAPSLQKVNGDGPSTFSRSHSATFPPSANRSQLHAENRLRVDSQLAHPTSTGRTSSAS